MFVYLSMSNRFLTICLQPLNWNIWYEYSTTFRMVFVNQIKTELVKFTHIFLSVSFKHMGDSLLLNTTHKTEHVVYITYMNKGYIGLAELSSRFGT